MCENECLGYLLTAFLHFSVGREFIHFIFYFFSMFLYINKTTNRFSMITFYHAQITINNLQAICLWVICRCYSPFHTQLLAQIDI